MANNGFFKINIGVIDNDAIKKLKDINKELYAAQAPIRAYQRELKKFNDLSGRTAGLKKYNEAMSRLKGNLSSVGGAIGSVLKPMAAVFGIGSVAGVVALTRQFASFGNEVRNTSALLGVNAQEVLKLKQYGNLAGLGDQTHALRSYQDTQTNIQAGGDARGAYANSILGINPNMKFEDAQIRAVERVNQLLKERRINQSGARNLLNAAGLNEELVGQDPKRLREAQRIATQNAKEMAPYAQQAAAFRDHLAEAASRVDVLRTRLASSLEPALGPIIQKFIDWSKDNKAVDETMSSIADAAKNVGQWISKINVDDLRKDFSNLKTTLEIATGAFIAIKAISLASWSVQVGKDIATVIGWLGKLRGAAVVGEAAVAGEAGGLTAMAASLSAAAAPILAACAAVAGVSYAGYKLYNEFSEHNSDDGRIKERQRALALDPVYHSGNRLGTLEKNTRTLEMMDYLTKVKGLSEIQAAGVVSQAVNESGLNEKAIGDNGSAVGMFQWHPDRQKNIENQFGKSVDGMTWKEQTDVYLRELNSTEKKSGDELNRSKTLADSTVAGLDSERSKDWLQNGINGADYKKRLQSTKDIYKYHSGKDISGDIGFKITLEDNRTTAQLTHNNTPLNPNLGDVKTQTRRRV